jgi:putative ATP-dependent endonuclease of the OLD family
MQIKEVILENFRGYKNLTRIPISSLTAFIGKNDAGKSTILEALDIFFEGGVKKVDQDDASKGGDPKNVRIGVCFNNLPDSFILDTNAATTLANEYLVNQNGDLEIHKIYNCSLATPKPSVFACAVHPTKKGLSDLIQKSNKDLKDLIKAAGLGEHCNKNENPSMRLALYKAEENLETSLTLIPLNEANGKAIWAAIQEQLPLFALFQSDRPSTDQDSEVQDPMKLAIKKALDQLESELNGISDKVQESAQKIAEETLKQLSDSYPDLATSLTPSFKKPKWDSIFKLELKADDEIPLNKRGSGVRRLILMSFFQAEAEKKRSTGTNNSRPVIYAIEEPETSQHPDSQERIIETLKKLSSTGDQVILTTHVPALAGLIPLDSLRYIDKDPSSSEVRVRSGSDEVYTEVASALGILPEPASKNDLKVAVLLEGKYDIDTIRFISKTLLASGDICSFNEDQVFWTLGGGTTLKDWIERGYLDKLQLPQVIIKDSDRSSKDIPLHPDAISWQNNINQESNKTAFITNKRNMDNYFHSDALHRLSEGTCIIPDGTDVDFVKMEEFLHKIISEAYKNNKLKFHPLDEKGNKIPIRKNKVKHIISSHIIKNMSADEIKERGKYQDQNGKEKNEIIEWFEAITSNFS